MFFIYFIFCYNIKECVLFDNWGVLDYWVGVSVVCFLDLIFDGKYK